MDERLKEIEEALSKATPGPWIIDPASQHLRKIKSPNQEDWMFVARDVYGDENAHLIANAPEWLRYTLNEIKRLQDALTVAGKRIDSYQD